MTFSKICKLLFLMFCSLSFLNKVQAQNIYSLQPQYECAETFSLHYKASLNISEVHETAVSGYAWTHGGLPVYNRGFIRFHDLDYLLPLLDNVESATLHLYHSIYHWSWPRDYCNSMVVSRITEDWQKSNITWENQPTIAELNFGEDYVQIEADDCACGTSPGCQVNYSDNSIDLTEMVQYWHNNPNTQFGIRLKLMFEEIYNAKSFSSANHDSLWLHPKLEIVSSTEIRFVDEEYLIENGELTITPNLENAFFVWNNETEADQFTITEAGTYSVTAILPNCFEITNTFEVKENIILNLVSPFNYISQLESEPFIVKPVKPSKPFVSAVQNHLVEIYNDNGTLIYHEISNKVDLANFINNLNSNELFIIKIEDRGTGEIKTSKYFKL